MNIGVMKGEVRRKLLRQLEVQESVRARVLLESQGNPLFLSEFAYHLSSSSSSSAQQGSLPVVQATVVDPSSVSLQQLKALDAAFLRQAKDAYDTVKALNLKFCTSIF